MTTTELRREAGTTTDGPPRTGMRPAALARHVDLSGLRHDFPLVLVDDDRAIAPLTGLVDELLTRTAPHGARGERLRQHVLRLEARMRRRLEREDAPLPLTELWELAGEDLLAEQDGDELRESLVTARAALRTDGLVVRCDDDAPATVLRHLHARAAAPRAAALADECTELVRRLGAVLTVDERRSALGRDPARLEAAVGGPHAADFDFDAWSEVLAARPNDRPMAETRRTRIEWALGVLRDQRFVATGQDGRSSTFEFAFDSCTRAMAAHHERVPELARLVKAMAIAQLELDNAYDETVHGAVFHTFDAAGLRPTDLAPFPGSLVLLDGDDLDPPTRAQVLDVLASPLPWKIVVVTRDALGRPPLHDPLEPRPCSGVALAAAALGLGTARVVQTTTAGLARMTPVLLDALTADGPALVSVVTGSVAGGADLHPYLAAAAVAEARLAPEYAYDPRGGPEGAARLTLAPTAQPTADWPVHAVTFEDEHLQRVEQDLPFTVADLVAVDPRFADHTGPIPRHAWSDAMVPVAQYLQLDPTERDGREPYVLVVDEHDVLRRVVVDDRVVAATELTLAAWRRLQELAGVRASEERRRLEEERAALEAARAAGSTEAAPRDAPAPAPPPDLTDEAPAPVEDDQDAAPPAAADATSDEAWIETARCTTCDECTNLNPRMFAYNDERQAYIADVRAGTFGELVQAAEACQVAIIHPGEPWDPDEPGLDDLRRRAAAFT